MKRITLCLALAAGLLSTAPSFACEREANCYFDCNVDFEARRAADRAEFDRMSAAGEASSAHLTAESQADQLRISIDEAARRLDAINNTLQFQRR